jgi:metal-responsive CopG/Arc/MetJ family transcriptional regulator
MKVIQITVDEKLLQKLDANDETRRDGRSAVFRRAVIEYLDRQCRRAITTGYRRAYSAEAGPGNEFEGWEEEGSWPSE